MYAEESEQSVGFDVFRYVDKGIKSFYKRICARDKLNNGRGKLPKSSESSDFEWNNIVDPHTLTEDTASISYSTISFEDGVSSVAKIIRLKDGPSGFYIISNLLPPESQLYWSRKALCEFSLEQYTNLTNLGKVSSGTLVSFQSDYVLRVLMR